MNDYLIKKNSDVNVLELYLNDIHSFLVETNKKYSKENYDNLQ